MSNTIYFVAGGVFTDGSFTRMEPGTTELYGPFDEPGAAEQVYMERTRRMVDTCWHKLFVTTAQRPGIVPTPA